MRQLRQRLGPVPVGHTDVGQSVLHERLLEVHDVEPVPMREGGHAVDTAGHRVALSVRAHGRLAVVPGYQCLQQTAGRITLHHRHVPDTIVIGVCLGVWGVGGGGIIGEHHVRMHYTLARSACVCVRACS